MPRKCSVLGCNSNYEKFLVTNKAVTTFSFPRDPVMVSKWLKVIPRKYAKISETTCLCENHFDPADIIRTFIRDSHTKKSIGSPVVLPLKKKILKKNAIPCKFPEGNWSHDCCVRFCRSNQKGGRKTFRMFPFPRDPQARRRWLRVMALNGINVTPESKVCERHFAKEEILTSQGESSAFLAKGAVPKIQDNQCVYISAAPPPAVAETAVLKLAAKDDWDPLDDRFRDEVPFDMQVCDMDGKPLGLYSDSSGSLFDRHDTDQNSLLNNFNTLREIMNRDYDALAYNEVKKESMIESLKTIRLELDRVETYDEYFVCRVCDMAYGSRQTMERHRAFHVDIKCETESIITDGTEEKSGLFDVDVENSMNFGTIIAFHNSNSRENDVDIDDKGGVAVGISIDFNDCGDNVAVPGRLIYDRNINASSAGLCEMIRSELEKRRLAIESIKKSIAEIGQIDRKIERLTSRVIESQEIVAANPKQMDLGSPVKSDVEQMDDFKLTQSNEDNAESISSEALEKHKRELENEFREVYGDVCINSIDTRKTVGVNVKRKIKRRVSKDGFACRFCRYTSKSGRNLRCHERQAHGDKEIFQCTSCQYKGNLKSVAVHKKLHLKLFCDDFDCNFTCKSYSAMKRHRILVHGETAKYKCGICGQVSLSRGKFKSHVMKHTGEKPLRCPHCDYRCRIQSDLCTHIKKHTVGRSYLCDICGAGFWDGSNLATHKRRHFTLEVKCKLCPFTSISACHMKMHGLKHVGESPFRCNFCDFVCRSAGGLKSHQKTHTVPTAPVPAQKKIIRIRLRHVKKKQPIPDPK